MRKIFPILTLAAAAAMATPAFAEIVEVNPNYAAPEVAAGAVTGTAVGVGLYEGWLGSSATVAALPATAAGAAAVGGVAGVGTVALLDAAVQPCAGFHALLGMNRDRCVNGVYVGDRPVVVQRHRLSMR